VKYELGFCIPEDEIPHYYRLENLISYKTHIHQSQQEKELSVAWFSFLMVGHFHVGAKQLWLLWYRKLHHHLQISVSRAAVKRNERGTLRLPWELQCCYGASGAWRPDMRSYCGLAQPTRGVASDELPRLVHGTSPLSCRHVYTTWFACLYLGSFYGPLIITTLHATPPCPFNHLTIAPPHYYDAFSFSRGCFYDYLLWGSRRRNSATSGKVLGSISDEIIAILNLTYYPSGKITLGLIKHLTEMSFRNLPGY
jgi:hypothetical protein